MRKPKLRQRDRADDFNVSWVAKASFVYFVRVTKDMV